MHYDWHELLAPRPNHHVLLRNASANVHYKLRREQTHVPRLKSITFVHHISKTRNLFCTVPLRSIWLCLLFLQFEVLRHPCMPNLSTTFFLYTYSTRVKRWYHPFFFSQIRSTPSSAALSTRETRIAAVAVPYEILSTQVIKPYIAFSTCAWFHRTSAERRRLLHTSPNAATLMFETHYIKPYYTQTGQYRKQSSRMCGEAKNISKSVPVVKLLRLPRSCARGILGYLCLYCRHHFWPKDHFAFKESM